MTVYASTSDRRFVRDGDRAVLGGVCAGIANYFGFNVRATRVLCIIAFFIFMPFVTLAYIALVLLVPAEIRKPVKKFRSLRQGYQPSKRGKH